MTLRTFLIVFGFGLDFIGIVMLALDVVAEPFGSFMGKVARIGRHTRRRTEELAAAFVRAVRRNKVVKVPPAVALAGGVSSTAVLTALKIPGPESPELIAWLRDRAIHAEDRLKAIEQTMNHDRAAHTRAMHELETALRADLNAAIAQSEGAYRGWRLLGLLLATIGVTLALIGSLLPT